MNTCRVWVVLIAVLATSWGHICKKRPHIIMIMADDMGWNDVGMHGSAQIPTPNIDALAYNGQNLYRHYTQQTCTPSRTALMTGNFPIRNGMQGTPLRPGERRDISPSVKFLATWLKKKSYKTHMVGKWHLGHYAKSITPTMRGFQTHLGYYNGFCGYFDYKIAQSDMEGFDLHRNNFPDWNSQGIYATELFTREAEKIIGSHSGCDPMFLYVAHLAAHTGANGTALEVPDPKGADERFSYITEPKRRLYAEIVRLLDVSTGRIVDALSKKNMLKDSIILWFSDNGGQTIDPLFGYSNYASNWPQRGLKFSLNEGGVRNIGAIWSPLLKYKNYVQKSIIHIVDWLPTLYTAAGGDAKDLGPLDGVNQWDMFTGKSKNSPERPPICLNIDEVQKQEGILSSDGKFKLLNGSFNHGDYDGYFGDTGRSPNDPKYDVEAVLRSVVNKAIKKTNTQTHLTAQTILDLRKSMEIIEGPGPRVKTSDCTIPCLYDLTNDPTEKTDVKDKYPDMYKFLLNKLGDYRKQIVPQKNSAVDPNSNPNRCNKVWYTWLDIFNFECSPFFAVPD